MNDIRIVRCRECGSWFEAEHVIVCAWCGGTKVRCVAPAPEEDEPVRAGEVPA